MPAVAIDIVLWLKEGKFLADAADIAAAQIKLKLWQKSKKPFLYDADLVYNVWPVSL